MDPEFTTALLDLQLEYFGAKIDLNYLQKDRIRLSIVAYFLIDLDERMVEILHEFE